MNLDYPYGDFPIKYTKFGQEQIKEKLNRPDNNIVETMQEPPSQPYSEPPKMDLSKMLPLIKLMGNKSKMTNADMLEAVLSLMGGQDMSEIISLFKKESPTEYTEEDLLTDKKIEEYIKIT